MVFFRQLPLYVAIGAAATTLHFSVLVLLVERAQWRAPLAALVGFCAGGVLSYLLNRRLTFASRRPHGEAAWRFAMVASVNFGLTYALMRLFVESFGAPYLPAQAATTLLLLSFAYTANRLWTFPARS